jgi:hypothetical protein
VVTYAEFDDMIWNPSLFGTAELSCLPHVIGENEPTLCVEHDHIHITEDIPYPLL